MYVRLSCSWAGVSEWCFWLAYVEGFTHHEIARLVGNAPASIRPLLARARDRFRRILDQCGYGDTGAR